MFLGSAKSSFRGQFPAIVRQFSTRVPYGNPRNGCGVFSVNVNAGAVLVEKPESETFNRLKFTYLDKIVPLLMDKFSYANIHQVPKVEKVVVNCRIGDDQQNSKGLEAAMNDIALITGQRPVKTMAKTSLASFKFRGGQTLGISVTLRGNVMYSFLDRLLNLGLPTSDFQVVNPDSLDRKGKYCIGIQEQSVFPEVWYDPIGKPRGMHICITTMAKTDSEAQSLLALMGMPLIDGEVSTSAVRKKKPKSSHINSKSKEGRFSYKIRFL